MGTAFPRVPPRNDHCRKPTPGCVLGPSSCVCLSVCLSVCLTAYRRRHRRLRRSSTRRRHLHHHHRGTGCRTSCSISRSISRAVALLYSQTEQADFSRLRLTLIQKPSHLARTRLIPVKHSMVLQPWLRNCSFLVPALMTGRVGSQFQRMTSCSVVLC